MLASSRDLKFFRCVQQKKRSAISRFAGRFFTVENVLLAVGWLVWVALVVYVQTQSADLVPFDPFEILKVSADSPDSANWYFSESTFPHITSKWQPPSMHTIHIEGDTN